MKKLKSQAITKIGEVTGLTHTDTGVSANTIFYYKVSTVFGVNETEKSPCGYGATGSITKDSYESNDTVSDAKEMGAAETIGSIYYIKEGINEIEDVDWYKVKLPATSLLQIAIQNEEKLVNQDITLIRDDGVEISVVFGTTYVLSNNNSTENDVYFRIVVKKDKMLNKSGKYMIIKGQIISN